MGAVIAFRNSTMQCAVDAPESGKHDGPPDYLAATCERIQKRARCGVPSDLLRRLERLDGDQLLLIQLVVHCSEHPSASSPSMALHLIDVAVAAIARGVRP